MQDALSMSVCVLFLKVGDYETYGRREGGKGRKEVLRE